MNVDFTEQILRGKTRDRLDKPESRLKDHLSGNRKKSKKIIIAYEKIWKKSLKTMLTKKMDTVTYEDISEFFDIFVS